jgi:hypothetical protein
MQRFIEIEGKRYAWRDIMRLRRQQLEAERRQNQPTLFELRDDRRPPSQQSADGWWGANAL